MSRRPRIGVTVSSRTGWRVYPFFAWALWRAGGAGARIDADRRSRTDCAGLDGLIVGGGDDISVELYGGEAYAEVVFDRRRDALEVTLLRDAERRELPVLGVCRGAQLINVVRGGTLHQDVWKVYPGARRIRTPLPRKLVEILPDTRLAEISGAGSSRVNALHSQSVARLGRALTVAARDEVKMVQAIESGEPRLVIGVQWHPEFLVFSRRDHALFRALVAAARSRRPA